MQAGASQRHMGKYYLGGWVLLSFIAAIVYIPGLSGPFLFDDLAELGRLGSYGGVVDWESFRAYVFGGSSGPTGRPVALVSFLIDANNWPTDAWAFKRTNLVIHICCGLLLGVLIRQVLVLLGHGKDKAAWVAIVAGGAWLLHPFLVSTTLYAVQRMAQLATLFVFAGMIGHIYGRSVLATNPVRAYIVMTCSLGVFTLLATLSKENGALLPLLIAVFEFTIVAGSGARALDRRWAALFIYLPSVLLIAFLVRTTLKVDFFAINPPRDFSIYERLLTQPRVLTDYLANWFIPRLYTAGVFQDHFIASRGLLSPATTLLNILIHVGAIAAAVVYRKRLPLVAFAALFFYAGHLLESTTINLELYFEHRNYMPAAFLFVPVIAALYDKLRASLFIVVAAAMILLLAGFTRYSSTVWSDYPSMVEASARKAPTSGRAQAELAKLLFNADRYQESLFVIDSAIERIPGHNPHMMLTRLMMLCRLEILDDEELRRVSADLATLAYDARLISIYEEFLLTVDAGHCPKTSLDAVHGMFAGMLAHPRNREIESTRYSQIQHFMGYADLRNGNPARAVAEFRESLRANASASAAMNVAALLATNGAPEQALQFSAMARERLSTEQKAGGVRGFGESDIDRFEETILSELSPQPAAGSDDGDD